MEIFDFLVVSRYEYGTLFETTGVPGEYGLTFTRSEHGPYGLYRVSFNVWVPSDNKTYADWIDFIRAVKGAAETFKFKDLLVESFYKQTLEALGSGNGSQVDFPLDMKYVDASTLKVYKDGVLQTLTTHYTLVTNDSAPTVRFVSAPAGGVVITATYEYYMPVKFAVDPPVGDSVQNVLLDAQVAVVEEYSGAHRV